MIRHRRKWAWPLLLPAWVALGVFFVAPLSIMFAMSFREKGPGVSINAVEDWREHFTSGTFLKNYRRTVEAEQTGPGDWERPYVRIFWRSIWIAAVTTVICLVVSYPVAYYLAILASPRRKNLLLALVVIPFWTSFLIRMGAWKLILGAEGVVNSVLGGIGIAPFEMMYTPFAVLIGLVYGELPFMILPLYASLEKMDRTLLEAAGDLGAGPAARFFRVTVPQTMPGIVAGVVLVFIPSVGQFVVSDILGGAKTALVGNMIERGFIRDRPFKSALAFELTGIVMLMLVVYAIYARKRKMDLI
jgi:spermidine/putrescine transport system permease protein